MSKVVSRLVFLVLIIFCLYALIGVAFSLLKKKIKQKIYKMNCK